MLDEDAVDAVLQDHQPPVEGLDGGGLRAVVGEEGGVVVNYQVDELVIGVQTPAVYRTSEIGDGERKGEK